MNVFKAFPLSISLTHFLVKQMIRHQSLFAQSCTNSWQDFLIRFISASLFFFSGLLRLCRCLFCHPVIILGFCLLFLLLPVFVCPLFCSSLWVTLLSDQSATPRLCSLASPSRWWGRQPTSNVPRWHLTRRRHVPSLSSVWVFLRRSSASLSRRSLSQIP